MLQIKVVFGERIRPSPYEITFGKNIDKCQVLCSKKYKATEPEDQKKLALLKKGMFMNYQHHWIVDNMPVTFFLIAHTVCANFLKIAHTTWHHIAPNDNTWHHLAPHCTK